MEKKQENALVWRESIYKNNYHCKCGQKLADPSDLSIDIRIAKQLDEGNPVIYCPICKTPVALVKKVDVDYIKKKNIHGEAGSWDDFENQYIRDKKN